jgi:periplasmic divalent cation tolerance protein
MSTSRYAEVHVSCAGEEEASRIGRALVERRLAACAQWWPIRSVYRWRDAVESDTEQLLVVKTVEARVEAVSAAVTEMHSYDLPAITWTVGDATATTGEWVRDCTDV